MRNVPRWSQVIYTAIMNKITIVRMSSAALSLSPVSHACTESSSSIATRSNCEFRVYLLFCIHPLEVKQLFQQLLHCPFWHAFPLAGNCSVPHLSNILCSLWVLNPLLPLLSNLQHEANVCGIHKTFMLR